jgi:hypothetical protein
MSDEKVPPVPTAEASTPLSSFTVSGTEVEKEKESDRHATRQSCRFYESEYPEIDQYVMVNVQRYRYCVVLFVSLSTHVLLMCLVALLKWERMCLS